MEIFRLKEMLEEADIEYASVTKSLGIYGNLEQVAVYKDGERLISVIQGRGDYGWGSYGSEVNRLEIMGLLTPEESARDSVAGYLTAEDVFQRIKKAVGE